MTPITSYYLNRVLDPEGLADAIDRVKRVLIDQVGLDTFDAIAFRGVSGALVAPGVAAGVGKPLIVVRKQEPSHGRPTEGALTVDAYLIVDDFVGSGETVLAIIAALPRQRCRGVVTYQGSARVDGHSEIQGWEV